jgi:DNA adenine methylase
MTNKIAKPFLKWAGGKTQLIDEIKNIIPGEITNSNFTYIEPFVGSGAILFWMLNNFPKLEKAVINDINADLINTYQIIASKPNEIISLLKNLQDEYHSLESKEEEKKEYYYQKRELYNTRNTEKSTQAALFIFLNRTCFNGLYRVNKNNGYNVPMGSYKKPMICDTENILAVSEALQKVDLLCGDFEETINYASDNTLFYFDPPYKPLSETSSFNSYAKWDFNDEEQVRLRNFCNVADKRGIKWMLSNSDVKGKNEKDNFFDDIYSDYYISRVKAKRSINANPEKRGELNELLITNYQTVDYIPALDFNKKDLFVKNFDKPYWIPKDKVLIDEIKIDKKLMSYDNPIYDFTINPIITNFDIYNWIPITVNKDFFLLDGQHRLEAAKRMKLKYIDVVIQDTELLEKSKCTKPIKNKKFVL